MLFNGTEYAEPSELALALQQNWDQAQEQLIQRTDGGALSQQVTLLLSAVGLSDAEALLKDTDHPPTRLANLLAEMNPDLPPVYRGRDIRPAALAHALTDPTTAGSVVRLVEDPKLGLAATGVMTGWRHLEGMSDAPVTEARLQDARAFLRDQDTTLQHFQGAEVDNIKAQTYAVAVQPEAGDGARRQVATLERTAPIPAWWRTLAADPSDYAAIFCLLTEPHAREQADLEHAQETARRDQAERQRHATESAEQQARQQRETERRSAQRARWRGRVRRWDWFVAYAIGLGASLILVALDQERRWPSSPPLSKTVVVWMPGVLGLSVLVSRLTCEASTTRRSFWALLSTSSLLTVFAVSVFAVRSDSGGTNLFDALFAAVLVSLPCYLILRISIGAMSRLTGRQ